MAGTHQQEQQASSTDGQLRPASVAGLPHMARASAPTPDGLTYVAVDLLSVALAAVAAHVLRFGFTVRAELPGPGIPYVLIAAASVPTWIAVLAVAGCYDRSPPSQM